LANQTVSLEDIPVAGFIVSSFGRFVMSVFQEFFTTPSWQTFTWLACGWALASERHTITTYLWLTGASTVKHFSRFYVFWEEPSTKRAGGCGDVSFAAPLTGCRP